MAVNRQRAGQVVTRLGAALGGLAGRVIAVLGLAFKPGTDDVRDSPAVALIHGLLAAGASVQAYDPLVRAVPALGGQVALRPAPEATLAGADAVVIATACPEFRSLDWQACARAMRRRVILDGRDALRGVPLPEGVTYLRIGLGAPAG